MASKASEVVGSRSESCQYCDSSWLRRKAWPHLEGGKGKPLTIVDLFSGCGGLSLGAIEGARYARRAIKIALAVDLSPSAMAVYRDNFKDLLLCSDVGDVQDLFSGEVGANLNLNEQRYRREHYNKIDLLMAGPPCQGHSDLNNRSRRNDPRNQLYNRVIRAVEVFQPTLVLIENVPAVVHSSEAVVQASSQLLCDLGYSVAETVVPFLDLGVAQRRKRHCLLAAKDKAVSLDEVFSFDAALPQTIRDVMYDIREEFKSSSCLYATPSRMNNQNRQRARFLLDNNIYDLPNDLRPPCHRDKPHSYVSMYGRLSWDKPAQTITSGFGSMGQGRYLHPDFPRTLTPHEAARIQGFPDFFSFGVAKSRVALQEMIGNAVPPSMSAAIVRHAIACGVI